MKRKLFIILSTLVLIITLLLSFVFKDNKEENNKEISKVEKILSKPDGIQAYTLNGEKTDLSYSDLISGYLIDTIACKNGTVATYNSSDNTITLSNIHMPDYCTINFKDGYTVSLSAGSTGTVSPASQTTEYNGSVSFTVTPSDGYKLALSTNTCSGTLSGNTYTVSNVTSNKSCLITFKLDGPPVGSTLLAAIKYYNPTIQTRNSFSAIFTATNTGTLYKATESIAGGTAKDVYYFAGDAKNNWVKFAGFYWRIIRTNHDGSIRLLYSGTATDTTSGYIGRSVFNSSYNSPKYVGYMYGTDGSLSKSRTNTNDSTIKTYIDNWYSTNLSSYTKYISTEAVYCNDRQLDSGQTWSTSSSSSFNYITYTRLDWNGSGANANPTYDCADSHDAFSASNTDAKLTYPIGLMTADEINIAGGLAYNNAPAYYYLNSAGGSITGGLTWWSLSPLGWRGGYSRVWSVGGSREPGALSSYDVNSSGGVRPVISLKGDLIWKSGDGSSASPYEVEDLPQTLYEAILKDNPTISTRTDFSTTFTTTNTGTLYKATESIAGGTAKDVYYFAGDAKNNWVKFGGFYWRIIRTNADGSIRMLYSGTSPDTTNGYIDKSAFNSSDDNSMYAGYMYGTSGTLASNRTNTNNSTIKGVVDTWYNNSLSSYTKYISTTAVYCNDREIGKGTYVAQKELNKNSDSMIAFVDINDTSNLIAAPDFLYNFKFSANIRLLDNKQPTYNCTNIKDAFSGSNTKAKLTYPIGLMTADEVVYAGANTMSSWSSSSTANVWYYLNSTEGSITGSTNWWTITPSISAKVSSTNNSIYAAYVDNASLYVPDVYLGSSPLNNLKAVRPVISIKQCALWSSGNGSSSSPYEVNGGC